MGIKIKYFFVALLFLHFKSMGGYFYCNMLWLNKNLPQINSISAEVDGNISLDIPLSISSGGISQATHVATNIPDNTRLNNVKGTYRRWFQFPSDWQKSPDGLKYKITSTYDDAFSQTPGFRTVVTPLLNKAWSGAICSTKEIDFPSETNGNFTLHIDRASAFPGRYNLQLPIKSAIEENKGYFEGQDDNGWRNYATIMKSYPVIDTKNISIDVRSKCNVSTNNIIIDYGNINANDALAGIKKNVSFNISCSAPTRVQLDINGGNVDRNKTSCGDGICTLNFSSGKASETLTLLSAGSKTVIIESLFKTNKITAGAFSGALIVKMELL